MIKHDTFGGGIMILVWVLGRLDGRAIYRSLDMSCVKSVTIVDLGAHGTEIQFDTGNDDVYFYRIRGRLNDTEAQALAFVLMGLKDLSSSVAVARLDELIELCRWEAESGVITVNLDELLGE